LTPSHIDRVLADFRSYLTGLLEPPPAPEREAAEFDLTALVAQFTALRHDVNLQTKATRAATDQAATAIQHLSAGPKSPPPRTDDPTKPLLKVLIEVADALATAEKQVQKTRGGVEPLFEKLTAPPTDLPKPGFFGKLFAGKPADDPRPAVAREATEKLTALMAGVADGYAMSRRRVEKVLADYGLEPIECVGRPFDPELMEVVEAVGGTGRASGVVVEVVRQGYLWKGAVFRFAQVRVAR
jgi:molecular chaperone GrpE